MNEFNAPSGATVDEAVPVGNIGKKPTPVYFDFALHEAVQKLMSKGIWCNLGQRFGSFRVRLRPFHVGAVVAKREAAERSVRLRLGLKDNDEIPGEEGIGITRAAMVMATTGAAGVLNLGRTTVTTTDPTILQGLSGTIAALDKARELGIEIQEHEGMSLVIFTGLEDEVTVRKIWSHLLEASITLLTQCFNTSKELQRVREEEIFNLGEAYVYGVPGEFDWRD